MNDFKGQFENYYNEYHDMVSSLCYGYSLGDKELTNDLVQETFINLWKAIPKFEARSSPKTWIYRICVNTCLLYVRQNKNKKTEELDADHFSIPEEPRSDKHFNELYRAIGELKDLDRIIIMMVLDDLPYSEIAEILGITEAHLRVKISRAKQRLNKKIKT